MDSLLSWDRLSKRLLREFLRFLGALRRPVLDGKLDFVLFAQDHPVISFALTNILLTLQDCSIDWFGVELGGFGAFLGVVNSLNVKLRKICLSRRMSVWSPF